MNHHRLTAYAYLLLVSAIWGIAGPIIKYTLDDFPPLIFLTYRFALNTFFALILWRGAVPLPKTPKRLSLVLLYSVLLVPITLGLLFFGFNLTSSIEGTLITTTSPILAAVAGYLFLRERVTTRERIGIVIALAGTLLVVFEPMFHGAKIEFTGSVLGNALVMLAMIVETIGFLIAKVSLRQSVSPFVLTAISFIVGFVVMAPLAIGIYGLETIITTIAHAPLAAHAGVWYMAFISGALAYTLKNKALKTIEVGESSVFNYLYPLFAAPFAFWWLGEKITVPFLVGGGIIAVGVLIAEYKKSRRQFAARGKK